MLKSKQPVAMDDLLALKVGSIWLAFKQQSFAFWMVCAYLFFEYVRPHSIIPALDILPWAQTFLLLSIVGLLADRNHKWVKSPINVWMLLFFLIIIFSSVFAYDQAIAWKHLPDFYTWLIIYFVVINSVTNEQRLFIFLMIFVLASAKLAFFGARSWAFRGFGFTSWGLMGPPGFFQNSGELAIQMSIFFGLSVSIFTALKNKVKGLRYWFLFLCPIAAAMTIMGANSRGAQLALAVQLLIIFKSKLSLKRVFWSLLVAILIYSFFPAQQLERFRSIGEDDTSQQRILYWENGLDMLHDHPMTGVGYFNYPLYYNTFYSQDLVGMRARKGAELPHNIFVQVGAELGFFGLLIYVALILQGISINARKKKLLLSAGKAMHWAFHMAIGLNVGLVGFFIAGQFVSVVYYPFFWISLALSVALGNILSSLK
jgi:putative inorganic carbon (HCO3(-)) transporter